VRCPRAPASVTAWMCAAHVMSMTAFSIYPTLLPRLQKQWEMSNSEAGFVGGALFAGYMAAVPVLTSLTDRVDARRVYFAASLLSVAGALGFAAFARGTPSAAWFQLLSGAGVAGTYMPGLKVLTDNAGAQHSRPVAFYTATFGFGVALSIVCAGFAADALGWRAAFALASLGPAAAGAMVIFGLPPAASPPTRPRPVLAGIGQAWGNRNTRPYIIGYSVHCWELFGSRAWMVAFLTFAQGVSAWAVSPVSIAAIGNLVAPVSSVLGNELALRTGRAPFILGVMGLSGALTCALGFLAGLPGSLLCALVLVHMALLNGDSSSLTAGVVAASEPELRGTTMALHSTFGFAAGFAAPLLFGAALDLAGAQSRPWAWGVAFATIGMGGLLAAFTLRLQGSGERRIDAAARGH
jgi:MFS family permease